MYLGLMHTMYACTTEYQEEIITAGSVTYKGNEDNPSIPQNVLRNIIEQAVAFAKNHSSHNKALSEILIEEKSDGACAFNNYIFRLYD
ncbi:6153_t:CDS:2 [Gigaspora margarita]|uniref:6153_t:CDS:1 n=1 Tax=Gigaspora margarita TaxID=4874 RepID=A0ABN7UZU2_GIGMA|nr:6153_t:CDS:2 [Gigaspora margarita]